VSGLVVVSNRGPANISIGSDGALQVRHGAGGLAPSLSRALRGTGARWVALAMSEGERRAAREGVPSELGLGADLRLVDLPAEVRDGAYRVVANSTLWFVLHGLFDRVRRPLLDRRWREAYERYREFNHAFADEVVEVAPEGATVVVHDYHLFLVGARLRERRSDLRTVHFTHTPFPAPDELEVLPRAVVHELLDSLGAFGACGFHTARWRDNFRAAGKAALGRVPAAFVAPLGTDAEHLRAEAATPACGAAGEALEAELDGRRLLLRSDRMELSKNLLRGFLAFEELLEARPDWRDRVVFVARAYPSRQELPEYLAYRSEVEHLVARINERFGPGGDRGPIRLHVEDDFPASVAALQRYDVLLVNPIRDGMNLVAKEGPVLNRRDGVLALSPQAGAFAELGPEAVEVEPFDVAGTALALERALELPAPERARRAATLARLGAAHPPAEWFHEVAAHAARPSP
jgi:trehalose 6-phosphate synthase